MATIFEKWVEKIVKIYIRCLSQQLSYRPESILSLKMREIKRLWQETTTPRVRCMFKEEVLD
jgi:hypothetical protein